MASISNNFDLRPVTPSKGPGAASQFGATPTADGFQDRRLSSPTQACRSEFSEMRLTAREPGMKKGRRQQEPAPARLRVANPRQGDFAKPGCGVRRAPGAPPIFPTLVPPVGSSGSVVLSAFFKLACDRRIATISLSAVIAAEPASSGQQRFRSAPPFLGSELPRARDL
jgi:hypothetical protein